MNYIPNSIDITPEYGTEGASTDDSSYMKFAQGYDNSGELIDTNSDYSEDSYDDSSDNSDDGIDTPATSQDTDVIEIDGVDVSFIPEELRRGTIKETLKAIEDSRLASDTAKTQATSGLDELKKLITDNGHRDAYQMSMSNKIQSIDAMVQNNLIQATNQLQSAINSGQIGLEEAKYRLGKYEAQLEYERNNLIQQEYANTNSIVYNKLTETSKDFLTKESVAKACDTMVRDIISDGNMLDEQRTMQYMELAKNIWEEAYKAGAESVVMENKLKSEQDKAKSRMTSQAQNKTSQSARGENRGMKFNSIDEIPQDVWNSRPDIRRQFGVK